MGKILPWLIIAVLVLVGIPIVLGIWLGAEATRDLVLIAWALLTIVALVFFLLWVLAMWMGVNTLVRDTRVTMRDDIRPLLAAGRETSNNVTGSARFLGDTIAQPVIRVYGFVSGLRRGIAVFTGLTGRRRRSKV